MTDIDRTTLLDERFLAVTDIESLRPWWMAHAACQGMGFATWFPEDEAGVEADAARQVCSACSVRHECLDYALGAHIRHGLWGGLTGKERVALVRRRARQARRGRAIVPRPTAA